MTAPERIWIDKWGGNWSPMSGGTQETEYIRADLVADQIRAAVQAEREACAVDVVPLVWVDFPDRGAKASAWNQANYMIQKWSDGRWEVGASYPGYSDTIHRIDRYHPTIEAAKAAAQADYESRIRAAIRHR